MFVWSDLVPILAFVSSLVLAIGVHLTPQDHHVPFPVWVLLWVVVVGFLIFNVVMFATRKKLFNQYRFACDGIIIGWTDDSFKVNPEEIQKQIKELLSVLSVPFPDALKALQGCAVLFREEKWSRDTRPGKTAQYVAGLQDGMFIQVGWNKDLNKTALKHELTHRVLQVYAGDPPQDIAHAMMAKMGIS